MTRKMKKIFKKIAEQNGVTVEEVEKEIAIAIQLARRNPDPTARAFWGKIEEDITPAEFVRFMGGRIGE